MITIKDMNERWLNEVKDYIIDSTIREYNIAYWDFLTSQVDNLEDYNSDRKDALAFDVKNMGYADYDEINKAFKKLGHDDLDAQDFSEDIYEICQFDNETIFHDIEDYLEVPFYAMGRMGGHWGVLCEDVCDKDLVDIEINEKELWKYIEKNYDLNDYDDIWDIDCEDVGRYADENCFNFVADKDFVKHLNDAWDEIKKQSDYMLTYDYAEYIAERLIEDNFLESKKSARKSIKESKVMSYDEFKKIVKKEFTKDEIEGFGKTDNGYGVYVIAYGEKEIEIMCDDLRQYGFECKWWHSSDPEDDEPIYFIEAIPIMNESKKSARKSIKESLNFKKDYAVSVIGTPSWLKPFYWDFDEFRDDLLIASEEEGFTYYITEATTTDYRINLEYNDGFDRRYDIAFRIILKSNKATAKELNDYLN